MEYGGITKEWKSFRFRVCIENVFCEKKCAEVSTGCFKTSSIEKAAVRNSVYMTLFSSDSYNLLRAYTA
jgi:hypothetical protein